MGVAHLVEQESRISLQETWRFLQSTAPGHVANIWLVGKHTANWYWVMPKSASATASRYIRDCSEFTLPALHVKGPTHSARGTSVPMRLDRSTAAPLINHGLRAVECTSVLLATCLRGALANAHLEMTIRTSLQSRSANPLISYCGIPILS